MARLRQACCSCTLATPRGSWRSALGAEETGAGPWLPCLINHQLHKKTQKHSSRCPIAPASPIIRVRVRVACGKTSYRSWEKIISRTKAIWEPVKQTNSRPGSNYFYHGDK
eukprot:scaffold240387_cov30-Tisochrysis_lutea.AAC.2